MDTTIKKICAGDIRTASRLIRDIEDKLPDAKAKIKKLYTHTGKSFIIGITGAPGAGKSTLTDALISEFRKMNKTVGVLAVDPTSPFTGGAILGDRIRMQRHAEDTGVFVRSLATRGALGGLSQAAGNAIHVMEAMGKDIIIVETVGIGQQEIDIINHAHTVLVVLVPGMGDEIQTMKAGLMEIADVFVINKADRAGARQLQTELSSMLNLSPKTADGWKPPIVMVGNAFEPATFNQNTAELAQKIGDHRLYLQQSGQLTERMHRKAMTEIKDALTSCLMEPVMHSLVTDGELEKIAEKIKNRKSDPYTVAEEITEKFFQKQAKK
ncbi:MAG TPA: methylmalonyl Co-A mutase-associated GTPase MeaB [Smithella sp.]|nr:methylmalonyl Co-A mutase-associated GTPase MeaB [Smithella sp.]MDM7986929.1 methylmalonyl Co-A mutase-associated GTPase MeaB [Smithella sp.]HNY49497.1 methylmalonyl Co-A mutase-associated GTPase MeaB [Smithella sp.]HOG89589.1 methylmalonyl Co-A mutase-associated GTPase MeaB [Smithella sp.]HOU50787.1 methylmalonyl Co-A mutase-associated GTPase MeaB [Smithella sp.]